MVHCMRIYAVLFLKCSNFENCAFDELWVAEKASAYRRAGRRMMAIRLLFEGRSHQDVLSIIRCAASTSVTLYDTINWLWDESLLFPAPLYFPKCAMNLTVVTSNSLGGQKHPGLYQKQRHKAPGFRQVSLWFAEGVGWLSGSGTTGRHALWQQVSPSVVSAAK